MVKGGRWVQFDSDYSGGNGVSPFFSLSLSLGEFHALYIHGWDTTDGF